MMDNKTFNSQKMNILIIEDEGDISLILNLMLKKEDIEIEHVTTLANAATFLKEQSPDIVIIDNQLPDGLGLEYIKEIKSSYPLIKIIMIPVIPILLIKQQLYKMVQIFFLPNHLPKSRYRQQ